MLWAELLPVLILPPQLREEEEQRRHLNYQHYQQDAKLLDLAPSLEIKARQRAFSDQCESQKEGRRTFQEA